MIIDLDNDIFNSDEFEEDKEQIYEEGVDSEL